MKEDLPRRKTAGWGALVSKGIALIACLACLVPAGAWGQRLPLTAGERVDYDLYFKWGLIMSRAGQASLSVDKATFAGSEAWRYDLLFRSAGIVERIFAMRDTMVCHFSPDHRLIEGVKRSDEGGYYLVDELRFAYPPDGRTKVSSLRYNRRTTKIDTVLVAEGLVYDMLGATLYLRSIDWKGLSVGDEFPFTVAIGRDLVNTSFRYAGQRIVEHGEAKYRTRLFYIDIYDEAFTQSKEAAEVWIGDDENHVPVKIRAKLKIGAAEVHYRGSRGLRAPLNCRVVVAGR